MKYKPDFQILDKLSEEGFLRKVISPCGRLMLYNYTDYCIYERKWNKHTLNSRGTVYEISTGKTVAQAFPKFFNFSELAVSRQRNLLKQTSFEVYEKMDGSLGIIYFYDGKWRVNTRGSFTSDQAIKATQMLEKYDTAQLEQNFTYLAEIIYPENRIIVDYGSQEKLALLAIFDKDGDEISIDLMRLRIPFEIAPRYHDFKSLQQVVDEQARLDKMEEGFVVRFKDGTRAKFKGLEYLKIARLLSELTPLNFWKAMKDGVVQSEIIAEIPEEFRPDADKIKNDLEISYFKTKLEILEEYRYAIQSIGGLYDLDEDRKRLGIFLQANGKELKHSGAMFPMLLKSGLDKYIMKVIRPVGNQIQ